MNRPDPAPTPSSPQRTSRRARWLWLLASPLIGLGVLELGLRVAYDGFGGLRGWLYMTGAVTAFESYKTLPELLAASGQPVEPYTNSNDFVLNSRGLRTIEYESAKAPGVFRIVVLGDSHSWASGGIPYLDLWHSRMQSELAACAAPRVETINLAVPAVGPDFEKQMWEVEGARLHPDLVVLAFSVGNDFLDVEGELADRTWVDALARRCYSARLARNVVRYYRLRADDQAAPQGALASVGSVASADKRVGGVLRAGVSAQYDRSAPKYSESAHLEILRARLAISSPTLLAKERFERACERVGTILAELSSSVTLHGARLVLLAIPDEHQLDDALLDRLAADWNKTRAEFDVGRAQRWLRATCAREGIVLVDPLPELRERATHEPMFNVRETHLNDLGHAVLARRLVETFRDERLIEFRDAAAPDGR